MKNTLYHGRPEDVSDRLEKEIACYALLDSLGVAYDRVDHDFADTIEACEAVEQVLGERICKNLFLCNRQKTSFYLLMMPGEKARSVPLETLGCSIDHDRLESSPVSEMCSTSLDKTLAGSGTSETGASSRTGTRRRRQTISHRKIVSRFGAFLSTSRARLTAAITKTASTSQERTVRKSVVIASSLPRR